MCETIMRRWLLDPVIGKSVAAAVTLVFGVVRAVQRSVGRIVKDLDTRYRARRFVSFLGQALAIVMLATVLSDRLGGFTVAFGVAGAGIASTLQELIASVAGWGACRSGTSARRATVSNWAAFEETSSMCRSFAPH